MPSYKTHSIHGEVILPEIDKKTEIDKEDLKIFCLGPDTLIGTNPVIFKLQHVFNTKGFYLNLLKLIKRYNLQDNSEVMAFLYGQLSHFVLAVVTHPLIYYMTEGIPKEHVLDAHGLVEHNIDDYMMDTYNIPKGPYYHKLGIRDIRLYKLINKVYDKAYRANGLGLQYNAGIISIRLYDLALRRDKTQIFNTIAKAINLGEVKYHDNFDLVKPFLNLEHDIWQNPETGEEFRDSFDDLWKKACELALETIHDVNMYLYQDKPLNSSLILDNISYNTGLPCEIEQSKKYIKVYK